MKPILHQFQNPHLHKVRGWYIFSQVYRFKKTDARIFLLAALLMISCFGQLAQAQYIKVNDTLSTGTTLMKVKGLQGIRPSLNKQRLQFGTYHTLDLTRNSTKINYHYSQGLSQYWGSTKVLSSENFTFQLIDDSTNYIADALCTNQFDSFPDNWLFQSDLMQNTRDLFTGSFAIRTKNTDKGIASDPDSLAKPNWNFVVRNINKRLNTLKDTTLSRSLFGELKVVNKALLHEEYRINQSAQTYGILAKADDKTEQIQINAVSGFNRKILMADVMFGCMPGYEFRYKGQVIGAVEVIFWGHVWMKEDLDPKLKFVVATMAVALLGQAFQKDQ